MRIAHAASELFPYLKTGGLADAVAALTGTLADRGHELAVFMPGYRSVLDGPHVAGLQPSHKLKIEMGELFLAGDVYTLALRPGLTLYLVCRAPVLLAPAMNGKMWQHPATQKNVETLRGFGAQFVEPASGMLACGYEGVGRLAELETILEAVRTVLSAKK